MTSHVRACVIVATAAVALCACDRAPPRTMEIGVELRKFDRDVVERLRRLPDAQLLAEERAIIARGTTLTVPATQAELDALGKRIGKPLPPSYRDFLATSNGMLFFGATNHVTMHGAAAVEPLGRQMDPGFEIWRAKPDVAIPLVPEAGGPLPGAALARAWTLSSIEDGDVYLIFPDLAGPDGEWPVWNFGTKNPGAIAYPSFGAMLARERPQALAALGKR